MPVAITRTHYKKNDLPTDIKQKVGGLNLLFVDGFSKVRAVSSVFFKRTFSVHEGLFDEVDPLAREYSNDFQEKLYERSQRSIFDKNTSDRKPNKKPTAKEKQKALGKLSMVFIDVASGMGAFTKVLFKRFSTQYEGLIQEANKESSEFSYNTSMKLYKSANGGLLSSQKKSSSVRSKPKLPKVEVLVRQPLDATRNESEVSAKPRSYKRTAFVIALIGVVVLLAYYVFPMFQLEMGSVNDALKTEFVKERRFYMFNKTEPHCLDVTSVFTITPDGKREPYLIKTSWGAQMIYSWSKRIAINCKNLTPWACKAKCMSIKKSIFG
ncbi:MAG: hypothetical protein K1060chlam4_01057 [Candidatus Anoxychlamydiales bacterium]|nr:hypothetical protein [Candidatus Anoxychlamydiales bacterium]